MRMLLPQIAWTGMSAAYYSGILTDIVAMSVKPEPGEDTKEFQADQQFKATMAMVAFGVGEVLGCFFIGWVVDRFGSRNAAWTNVTICLIMTALTLVFLILNEYNALAFVMCFMWGI